MIDYNINLLNEKYKKDYASFLRYLKNKNILFKFVRAYKNGHNKEKDFFVFINEKFETEPFSNRNRFSSIIMDGFCWVDTKEGGNFWERIYSDLKGYIDGIRRNKD